MRVLFLYTELADYFIQCCEQLALSHEVHIVRWPVNPEAPFRFVFSERLRVYDKNSYNSDGLTSLVSEIDPELIVCSGWIDRDYLRIIRQRSGKQATVLAFDTHWRGDLKQHIAVLAARFLIRPWFSHVWVPGTIQKTYALRMGYPHKKIQLGFYCCDLNRFNPIYEAVKKNAGAKKRFVFAGRYYPFKGITELWAAFAKFSEKHPDWELYCAGNGSIPAPVHPRIRHLGFLQPDALQHLMREGGVFVLPSRFEPWGVVVHEFASAGFPLVLSDRVGAAEVFLNKNENGFDFTAENPDSLHTALEKIANLSANQLNLMSEKSHELAQKINPESWVNTVEKIYHDYRKK